MLEGSHERVLDGILGQVEVAEDADQAGERPTGLPAKGLLDGGAGIAHPPQRATSRVA